MFFVRIILRSYELEKILVEHKTIFSKMEMQVLLRDAKNQHEKNTGCRSEVERTRDNRRRQLARERVQTAIKSLTWYIQTQPKNQLGQVFQTNDVCEMILALCNNIPDSELKLKIIANQKPDYVERIIQSKLSVK